MAHQGTFSLFKKADMEGYLDKISSGITSKLLSGKTRMWCELFGATFLLFKDKASASGGQQLDMRQAHAVRKAANDKTGTQFEILYKNKSLVFCASTAFECSKWMQHLQNAMTLKDQEEVPDEHRLPSVGDYETIPFIPEDNQTTSCIKIGESTGADSGYAEVEIQNPPPAQASAGNAGQQWLNQGLEDDGYATVEITKEPESGLTVVQLPPVTKSMSHSLSDKSCGSEETYEYASVDIRKKQNSQLFQASQDSSSETGTQDEGIRDSYGYATVSRKPSAGNHFRSNENAYPTGDPTSDVSSDDDDVFANAESFSNPDPIPQLPHPLMPEDFEPLAAVKDFLSNNKKLCRSSFSDKTVSNNPVDDMKRLLKELHV